MVAGKVIRRAPRKGSEAAVAEQFESQTGYRPEQKPTAYRAYRAQQRGESPNGNGTTDEAPVRRGPRAAPKVSGRVKLPRIIAGFKRQAMRQPRRVLLLEMLAVLVIVSVSRVAEGEAPKPSDYLAPFVVYLVLSFAAEVGGSTARLASVFGALILLSVLVAHASGIIGALEVVTFGPGEGPTTLGAQGVSGFTEVGGEAGQGSGGGGGGSF